MPKFERITLIIESLPGARAQVQVNIPTPMPGMRLETPAHTLAIDALGWLRKQPAVAGFVYGGQPHMPPQCLHQIAEPAQAARTEFEAVSRFMKCEWNLDWDPAGFYEDTKTDTAFTWFEQGYMRAQQAAAPQAAAHPDDAAVDALAVLMKAKLAEKRAKGYGGWNDKTQCPQQRLSDMLRAHVDKGDPVDVANFCAMLSARYEGIAAPSQVDQVGGTQLPVEVPESDTLWLLLTGGYSLNHVRSGLASGSPQFENEAKVLRQRAQRVWAQIRMETEAPAAQAKQGGAA